MDAIERAIRSAFEKGDPRERAFREKVYRSAFAALERTLEARDDLPEAAKRARRDGLKLKITEIETEFMPAVRPAAPRPDAPPQPAPRPDPQMAGPPAENGDADFVPRVEREERRSGQRPEAARETARRIRAALPRRQRPFAMLYLVATLLAFAGIGVWWAMSSGLFLSDAQRDTSVRNPPLTLQEENFDAGQTGGEGSGSRPAGDWIAVFAPQDPTTVAAPGNASAEVMQDEDRVFLRISGAADTGVIFDVGQGILQTLAGRRAIFAVDARAQDGAETQISISCHFGVLGDCGRTRYVVGATRADYLFEVELPEGDPRSGGTIAIVPDLDGSGRALDVFGIRVAPATQ